MCENTWSLQPVVGNIASILQHSLDILKAGLNSSEFDSRKIALDSCQVQH